MITIEMLQDLAAAHDGIIPSVVDLSDTDKDRIAFNVMTNDDNEAIEYLQENSELSCLYDSAPEDAVNNLKNAIWAAIESSVSDQIDQYNAERLERDSHDQ